jgi:hypothetical protein
LIEEYKCIENKQKKGAKPMKIYKSLALGILGAISIMPNVVLANGDRQIQYSHTQTDLGYGFEMDRQKTLYEDGSTGGIYEHSQTHIQRPTTDNTYIYGGSNSRDYVNTNKGDRSTYEFGIKYEY